MHPIKNTIPEIERLSNIARIACAIEASVEKIGNVTPTKSFEDMSYNNFLVSSILIGEDVRNAAYEGYQGSFKLGIPISNAVKRRKEYVKTNTNFGIIMMFIPIAKAFGKRVRDDTIKNMDDLRRNVTTVIEGTTVEDALYFCDALGVAGVGGLDNYDGDLDVKKNIKEEVRIKNITFRDLMNMSKGRDRIASELVSGMDITFNEGYKEMESCYEKCGDIYKALQHVYLKLLAKYPDTLIIKKGGEESAAQVQRKALGILERGGVFTEEGIKEMMLADAFMRENSNKLNPGTTADITAAILFVFLIKRFFCSHSPLQSNTCELP